MEANVEVIGVDHGWSMMKTANCIFTTGVGEIKTEPAIFENILEYEGRFYQVGGKRLTVKDTKVENEKFYLLTLAAIAKELKLRGKVAANVYLAVGLPYTRYGDEKKEFLSYLEKKEHIKFTYEKQKYSVKIERVSVYPQCYAAIVERLGAYNNRVVAVDIGSWTIDVVDIIGKSPSDESSVTIRQGLIVCMREINKQCVRLFGNELDEVDIQEVMRYGTSSLNEKYLQLIKEHLRNYTLEIYDALREHKFNTETTQIVFVGGGASVMKLFSTESSRNISYVEDVCANAKGYELLAKIALKKGGR